MDENLEETLAEARERHPAWHHCRDCDKWYGAEDDEYGPCMYKDARREPRFVTHGSH